MAANLLPLALLAGGAVVLMSKKKKKIKFDKGDERKTIAYDYRGWNIRIYPFNLAWIVHVRPQDTDDWHVVGEISTLESSKSTAKRYIDLQIGE